MMSSKVQLKPDIKSELRGILDSPIKRLQSLYWQVDKYGNPFKFAMNDVQQKLYRSIWYLNVILKARQAGVTTLIQLFMLDRCLFNHDIRAGVIAHNREDAENFFKHKIKYAYDHLPEAIRHALPAKVERAGELAFENGSSIRVGTSMRSDTLQYLHISEFGKICAKMPEKAAEIISGSLNTVVPGQFIFVESTAEGAYGRFFDICKIAERKMMMGLELTVMDYRFFFFAWFTSPEYTLKTQVPVPMPEELALYFEELENDHNIILTREQKNWYIKKSEEQGDHMWREYPSTPEDAFRAIVEGAVFGKQMRELRRKRQILKSIPVISGIPVNTFWDLGRNDNMVIWFHQRVGPENRFIDYIEDSGHNMQYYIKILLNEKNYVYGKHYMPHDVRVTDLTQSENLTRMQVAERAGLRNIVPVERIPDKEEAHELGRQALSTCFFSEEGCKYKVPHGGKEHNGITGLENYRYEYNEKMQQYSRTPLDNKHTHPADAFMQFAQAYNPNVRTASGGGHTGMY